MEGGNLNDALELLEKSLAMNKAILGEEDYSNCNICNIMARVYMKKKMYKEAIQQYSTVWEFTEAKYGMNSNETVQVFIELSDAYDKNKEYKDAIDFQKRAYDIYKGLEDIDQSVLGTLARTLSDMYSHNEMYDNAIVVMREVLLGKHKSIG